MLLANKLYTGDGFSYKTRDEWNERRENYYKIIEEKKREQELKDPNNIVMPMSSKSLIGEDYEDVIQQLKSIGFTNITSQVSYKKPGFFDGNNEVEHILIGGKMSFTTDDYFKKDDRIIIYYYSK